MVHGSIFLQERVEFQEGHGDRQILEQKFPNRSVSVQVQLNKKMRDANIEKAESERSTTAQNITKALNKNKSNQEPKWRQQEEAEYIYVCSFWPPIDRPPYFKSAHYPLSKYNQRGRSARD
jgi:hypothetical protein